MKSFSSVNSAGQERQNPRRKVTGLKGLSSTLILAALAMWGITLESANGIILSGCAMVVLGASTYFIRKRTERFSSTASAPSCAIWDEIHVGLMRLDRDGRILELNPAAESLMPSSVMSGSVLSDAVEGVARPIATRLGDVFARRSRVASEMVRVRAEGFEKYLQLSLSLMHSEAGECVLATIHDATELKSLEAQFVQSQKMQAVGQLAGGVAHDFNNILTAISGHADLLLHRHERGDADHADLVQIRQNSNRAASLIKQLLAFSRKQTLRPQTLRLSDVLGELSHLLNRLLGKAVTLRIENGENVPAARVDVRQFEQVIMNLVVNARDAMPNGGEVRITTSQMEFEKEHKKGRVVIMPGRYVRIVVADTGKGIAEDKIDKIFEPFFTTKKMGEGTGLGLSTVYGIIKQTGGFVFADSVVGEGTEFEILLPAAEDEIIPQQKRVHAAPAAAPQRKGKRILLVEDEAPVRSFATRALQLRGYSVIEADCGEAALEQFPTGEVPFDLIISDVIMPGKDGPTWVKEAKSGNTLPPVLFISGFADDSFPDGSKSVDGTGFLLKPFSLLALSEKVEEMLAEDAAYPEMAPS